MTVQEKYQTQITWLMEGDPAIRYQTLRDLLGAPEPETSAIRNRILQEGWGKGLMDLQDEQGTWSGALYSPKWTSTFYTLLLLKRFGAPADPRLKKACRLLLEKGFYEKDGGINYWKTWNQGECCVTGMLLSMLCHFQCHDDRIPRMIAYLFDQQMADKGWNCERPNGARHSSFHTTISVLEGLWEYEKAYPRGELLREVRNKQREGTEFLLEHRLFRSSTTGEPVHPDMMKLSFPPRWHYDILRCLDYFQESSTPKDKRMNDAMDLLEKKKTPEGFWKLEKKYTARVFFEMEKVGKPSRWNTLRVLRVLGWWGDGPSY
jgi:hypothetical protein